MIKNFLIDRRGTPITPQLRESLPDTFTNPFSYSPHPLCQEAMMEVCSYLNTNRRISALGLLREGKMFGVLVAQSQQGELGYLAAYSGVLDYLPCSSSQETATGGAQESKSFFVPPVYDLTSSESFFPDQEREITNLNEYIDDLVHDSFAQGVCERIEEIKQAYKAELDALQQKYQEGKAKRDALRRAGAKGDDLEKLVKESQFQKGEIRRAAIRMKEELEPYESEWKAYQESLERARKERREKSAALQKKIFDHFSFLNARGERKSLLNIFGDVVPPAGAGECAAPRLLQYAYLHGYKPIAMGEFWYGTDKLGRRNFEFYPSCNGKCGPILQHMLQGLKVDPHNFHSLYGCDSLPDNYLPEIIYEDDYLLAVNKPAGVLSVPGKDTSEPHILQYLEKTDTLANPIQECHKRQQKCEEVEGRKQLHPVHRLDMHTSGLLLFAKDMDTYKFLQQQFAQRKVTKCYKTIVDGVVSPATTGSGVIWKGDSEGVISLPLAQDYYNRPLQCVDYENGKPAHTIFRITGVKGDKTYVDFYPVTGRTHQLRVHSAHKEGLNAPIEGDLLYGRLSGRLMLHATSITFTHPQGNEISLEIPCPWADLTYCGR